MDMYQVDVHYDAQFDEVWGNISEYYPETLVGRIEGTTYMDGSRDYTDWCVYVGTLEECEKYCTENGLD